MDGSGDEVYQSVRMGLLIPLGTIKLPRSLQKTWKTASGYICGWLLFLVWIFQPLAVIIYSQWILKLVPLNFIGILVMAFCVWISDPAFFVGINMGKTTGQFYIKATSTNRRSEANLIDFWTTLLNKCLLLSYFFHEFTLHSIHM